MISKDTSGISIVVMLQPSKLIRRVRFPYPAPKFRQHCVKQSGDGTQCIHGELLVEPINDPSSLAGPMCLEINAGVAQG